MNDRKYLAAAFATAAIWAGPAIASCFVSDAAPAFIFSTLTTIILWLVVCS